MSVAIILPQRLYPIPSSRVLDELGITGKPRLDAQNDRLKLQNDARMGIIQAFAGTAVLLGAFFAWRQLQLGQEGQITDRFSKAIDQLGSDSIDVQIGGIHALERLAKDSKTDRPAIRSILSSYIRRLAPWPPSLPGQFKASTPLDQLLDLRIRAPHIHATLGVVTDPNISHGLPSVRLSRTDLRKASLLRADLRGAMLESAHLEESVLTEAHLEKANLTNANLREAYLDGAHLEGAYLIGAQLEGAYDMDDAHLKGAYSDNRTIWPKDYDPKKSKVIVIPSDLSSDMERR